LTFVTFNYQQGQNEVRTYNLFRLSAEETNMRASSMALSSAVK